MTLRNSFACVIPSLVLLLVFSAPSNGQGDKFRCPLNATSPFSYVVMIWDQNKYATPNFNGLNASATMGSLITCCAVLTTAFYYVNYVLNDKATFDRLDKWNRFRVIGQDIYIASSQGRLYPCYQNVSITDVQIHPKTNVKGVRLLFDFAVVVLTKPFKVRSPTFPTMFFPTTTLELLLSIRYVNIIESDTFCSTPIPEKLDIRDWIFNERVDVRTKPFHTQCLKRICEQKRSGGGTEEEPDCVRVLNERLNATMLCMVPSDFKILSYNLNPDGSFYPNALAGTPLVCNGSVLGMSNFIKTRAREFYPEYPQDIYFYVTLLRVLPWLIDRIKEHSPPVPQFHIEDKGLTRKDITEPSRLTTEDWGFNRFYTIPFGDNPFPASTFGPEQDSLAPSTIRCSMFLKTLLTSLLPLLWNSV